MNPMEQVRGYPGATNVDGGGEYIQSNRIHLSEKFFRAHMVPNENFYNYYRILRLFYSNGHCSWTQAISFAGCCTTRVVLATITNFAHIFTCGCFGLHEIYVEKYLLLFLICSQPFLKVYLSFTNR